MGVELYETRVNEIERDGISDPKKQHKIYTQATELQEGTEIKYPHLDGSSIYRTLKLRRDIPEDDPSWTHKGMSPSDLELASNIETLTTEVPEHAVKGAIRGSVLHSISNVVNECLVACMKGKSVEEIPMTHVATSADDQAVQAIIKGAVKRNFDLYSHVDVGDVPQFAADVWNNDLRGLHLFQYQTKHRHLVVKGDQYSPDWIYDYWSSPEFRSQEQALFECYQNRIREYWNEPDLFNENTFLPLECNRRFEVSTEEFIDYHIEFGNYRIKVKGMIDYALRAKDKLIGIDSKFGKPDNLFSAISRVQILLYSFALKCNKFSKNHAVDVIPDGVEYYFHVFDLQNKPYRSYYLDASIRPDEYLMVLDNLCLLTEVYANNYEYIKEIKKAHDRAYVAPFLADPN